jgi:perosamine synthetase
MIPYGHQTVDKLDIQAVKKVLESDYLTTGPKVVEFESAASKLIGTKYAVAVANGTAALHLSYLAAGLGPGDEVITSPNTFVATTNMLLAVGAKPVFCDIRTDTHNIDEDKIEKLINRKTRAIVPMHFAGHPCEMDKIWRLAKKNKLLVIEDAAHAFGAKYRNRYIGGGKSDLTTFSFHPVKSITTGEGGLIVTNNPKLHVKLKLLRNHGIKKDKNGFNVMTVLGYNFRLTELQAALGLSQLSKLKKFLNLRHQMAKLYRNNLKRLPQIALPVEHQDCYSAWHIYVINLKNPKHRLPLYRHLLKNGIGANFHYPAVYKHPYYRKLNLTASCPVADNYSASAITLPLFPELSSTEVKFICNKISEYFQAL